MSNMLIGYARVSTQDQDLSLQLDALTNYGCIKIFEEKVSGKNRSRPELDNMIEMLRPGDTVVVWKLDRIGRSMKHLMDLFDMFEKENINFVSLQENIDTSSPTGRLFFHIMAALAQFEREMTVERTKAGISAARARGRVGGRPRIQRDRTELALKMYDSKHYAVAEICNATGISKATLYRLLKKREGENENAIGNRI